MVEKLKNVFHGPNIKMSITSTNDMKNEQNSITNMALHSYRRQRLERDKEKAEHRRRMLIKSVSGKRHQKTGFRTTRSTKSAFRPSYSIGLLTFDAIKEVGKANNVTDRPSRKVLQVPHITLSMDNPSQRESAFAKRNQTSFSWYSQSLPNASSFKKLMNSFQESSSGKASKASASKKERPVTSYSYDGGVFTNPQSPKKEYFVIHPEWVSEAMTIQKLSLTERKTRSSTWPCRRCKSAPPPKYRNPITWEA